MRRHILVGLVVVLSMVVMPAGAVGRAPDFHDHFTESGVDPDFCGTGVSVAFTDRVNGLGWETDTTFRLSFNVRTTLTYAGKAIEAHSAGHVLAISDLPFDAPHTELVKESGLRSKLLIPGEGVVTSDHGLLVYRLTFVANPDPNAEEPLLLSNVEVLKDAGGHPDFFAPVFCAAATAYFGIPFTPED